MPATTESTLLPASGRAVSCRRALSRLERRGWVRPLAEQERRRPYEITAAGEAVLAEQLKTMQQVVRVGRQRTATA